MSITVLLVVCAAIAWGLGAANVAFKRGTPNWHLLGLCLVAVAWLVSGVRL